MSAIYYRHTGKPTFDVQHPPIIAMHGLFGSLENLGFITRQLSEDYCVYGLDLPNHGRSAHVDEVNLLAMAESVVAWMDEMSISSAHFLGHSLGGKIAMEIALRYPNKVQRLMVADIAPVAYAHRHQDIFDAFNAVTLPTLTSRAQADQQMQPHVSEPSTRSFLLKNLERKQGVWSWRMNLKGLIGGYEQLIAGNAQSTHQSTTHSTTPFNGEVLFIKGELSSYILEEHRQLILSLFPRASVKVISGTHHWLHAEKPDIFVGIVKRFLV